MQSNLCSEALQELNAALVERETRVGYAQVSYHECRVHGDEDACKDNEWSRKQAAAEGPFKITNLFLRAIRACTAES